MNEHRGAGFVFGRIVTAILGLVIGAGLFFWNSLGSMGFIDLGSVESGSTEGLENYVDPSDSDDEKLGMLQVDVDPDYPIIRVAQKDPQVQNLLVFGIDSRGEETSRADSIIVVTIDQRHDEIKLTSVLRDTEMNMNNSEGNRHKVNAAYAYGGVGMLINTLNSNLDLDIQKFVMFDFWSAMGFVDSLGGVTLEISEEERVAANEIIPGMASLAEQESEPIPAAGVQKLTGVQAISWARIRKIDSDFGRTSRQRQLMEAIIREFSQRNIIEQGRFGINVLTELETNMTRMDVVGSGLKASSALDSVSQYHVPQSGMYETNTSNWNMIYDPSQQIPALHAFIWGETQTEE